MICRSVWSSMPTKEMIWWPRMKYSATSKQWFQSVQSKLPCLYKRVGWAMWGASDQQPPGASFFTWCFSNFCPASVGHKVAGSGLFAYPNVLLLVWVFTKNRICTNYEILRQYFEKHTWYTCVAYCWWKKSCTGAGILDNTVMTSTPAPPVQCCVLKPCAPVQDFSHSTSLLLWQIFPTNVKWGARGSRLQVRLVVQDFFHQPYVHDSHYFFQDFVRIEKGTGWKISN